MKKRIIELSTSNRSEVLRIPLNPKEVTFKDTQLNQKVTLLDVGEANLLGSKGLIPCSFSSFFPSPKSPFYRYAQRTPIEYVALLRKWKDAGNPIRIIITDLNINLAMVIDSISITQKEGDMDIYYTLDLTEYRYLNVPTAKVNTTVKMAIKRPSTNPKKESSYVQTQRTYTIVGGDTLWGIAVKYYGNGSSYTQIYNANKDTLEATAKSRGLGSSNGGGMIFPGTVVVIP